MCCPLGAVPRVRSCNPQAMDLLAEIDAPNVRVHLDTYHMNIEEVTMQDAVATCADKLGCGTTTYSQRADMSVHEGPACPRER